MAIFPRGTRYRGRRMQVYEKNRDFRPISRFISEMIQDRSIHSYYGRRIGNRTQAFEWYQFQWPWVFLSDSEIFNDMNHRTVSLRQLSFLSRNVADKQTKLQAQTTENNTSPAVTGRGNDYALGTRAERNCLRWRLLNLLLDICIVSCACWLFYTHRWDVTKTNTPSKSLHFSI